MLKVKKNNGGLSFRIHELSKSYLSDKIKKSMKKLNGLYDKPEIDNHKLLSEDDINNLCQYDPLVFITECCADYCPFNRSTCIREIMEVNISLTAYYYYEDYDEITYTTYAPGYFHQDLILIAYMCKRFKKININFIMPDINAIE